MTYYPIDETLARRSHEMMSMSDYRAGSATAEYRAAVDSAAELVVNRKKHVSPFYHDQLDALLDLYARRLADWTNRHNQNGASCPSVLVCGASNFPIKKKERQNRRESALWDEYNKIQSILDKIRSVGTGAINLTDPHAADLLQDQLQKLIDTHKKAKSMNAWYRKHKTFLGFPGISEEEAQKLSADFEDTKLRCPWISLPFPDYELTSLRNKIKRTESRIKQLQSLKNEQASPAATTKFSGGEIVRNAEQNRLQIIFDDIPSPELRDALKSAAFRWSPRNKAWQRQLTRNAELDAKRVLHLS